MVLTGQRGVRKAGCREDARDSQQREVSAHNMRSWMVGLGCWMLDVGCAIVDVGCAMRSVHCASRKVHHPMCVAPCAVRHAQCPALTLTERAVRTGLRWATSKLGSKRSRSGSSAALSRARPLLHPDVNFGTRKRR
eukprot:642723-Rhodomonas_salina.2